MRKNKTGFLFKIVTILFFALLFLNCQKKTVKFNCDNFRKGKFLYRSKDKMGNIVEIQITRNEKTQIEENKKTGQKSKLSIKWIDRCKYELRILESDFIYSDSIQALRQKMILSTEILSSTDEYYIFESKSNISDQILKDTLWLKK